MSLNALEEPLSVQEKEEIRNEGCNDDSEAGSPST